MNSRFNALLATLALCCPMSGMASSKAAAEVKAAKGPIQITLRLQNTTVKVKKSLWYKLELKNIGKTKLPVDDRIFKDPYAMHVNSRLRTGIYLEVIGPNGKPRDVRPGHYEKRYDWRGPRGEDYIYSPTEKKEINDLAAEWKKSGMTEQQQSIAASEWNSRLIEKKNRAEESDPTKQLWLKPGASTTTFAWSDRGPGDYEGRSDDDESLLGGYTELWVYRLLSPGKYRVRAVYDYAQPESTKRLFKKHGQAPDPLWFEFKTPFIEIQVVP